MRDLQDTYPVRVRLGKQRRRIAVEQQRQLPGSRPDQLRRKRLGIVSAQKHAAQGLRLRCALQQKRNILPLVDHRPGQRQPPCVFLRHLIGDGNPSQLMQRLGMREQRRRVPIRTKAQMNQVQHCRSTAFALERLRILRRAAVQAEAGTRRTAWWTASVIVIPTE